MDPEQGLIRHRIEITVEFLVILVLQICGLAGPQRCGVVDLIVRISVLHLTVFPLLFLAEDDRNGQEMTVLLQQTFELVFLQEFLAVLSKMHDDIGSAISLFHLFQGEFR